MLRNKTTQITCKLIAAMVGSVFVVQILRTTTYSMSASIALLFWAMLLITVVFIISYGVIRDITQNCINDMLVNEVVERFNELETTVGELIIENKQLEEMVYTLQKTKSDRRTKKS